MRNQIGSYKSTGGFTQQVSKFSGDKDKRKNSTRRSPEKKKSKFFQVTQEEVDEEEEIEKQIRKNSEFEGILEEDQEMEKS